MKPYPGWRVVDIHVSFLDCPVRQAFSDLKPFMDQLPNSQGEGVYRLKEDFLVRFEERKLAKRLPKADAPPREPLF